MKKALPNTKVTVKLRKSNYKDANMDQVEDTINEILKKFPVANTIFCTKNNLD